MSDSPILQISFRFIEYFIRLYDSIASSINFLFQKSWDPLNQSQDKLPKQTETFKNNNSCTRIKSIQNQLIDESLNVSEIFSKAVQLYKDKRCLGIRQILGEENEKQSDGKIYRKLNLGDYQWFTYQQIDERVDNIVKGLLWSGVKSGDKVMIFAETRLEWMLSFQALLRIGNTVAIVYTYLGENEIVHCINETEVTHIITNFDLSKLLLRLEKRILLVKCIIFMEGHKFGNSFETKNCALKLLSFSRIEREGKSNQSLKGENNKPNDIAVIMYTSGSTGVPKGVMIRHKNLLKAMQSFLTMAQILSLKDVYIAYLPLAHLYELGLELFCLSLGMSIGYATPLTLTDKSTGIKKGCRGDATLLKPTLMAAVPLVLNRIRKDIEEQVEQNGYFLKSLFNFLIEYKKLWNNKGFKTPILNHFICRKLKGILGGNVRIMTVAGAPLAPETHEFIRACLEVDLLQGYGLTETSGWATLMDFDSFSVGHVGRPLPGVHIKLVDWDEGEYTNEDKPNPRGEVVIGGVNVSAGYYKNDLLTKECFKDEKNMRWFYSGDIGELLPDGTLKIIDRKKDLVKLQSGEYISLGKIEAELKNCHFVDNICVYGDSYHSYSVGLVVPNREALRALAERLSKPDQTIQELCSDEEINQSVLTAIQLFGVKSNLHKNEIPSKIKLCCEEWLPESGFVTAALKLRRKKIQDFYQIDLNKMYAIETTYST